MYLTYDRMFLSYNMSNPASLLLGTDARRAIFSRTYLDPSKEFYLRELVRLTGFAPRTIQQELDRLVASDLLTERRDGNRRYLSANQRHPLFSPIRQIVLMTEGLAYVLRDALGTEGIDFAFVFGSIADASPKAGSDVDVLVVGSIGIRETVSRLSPTQDVLGREVNPIVWTQKEYENRATGADHFLTTVLRGNRIMLVGEDVPEPHG